MRIDRLTLAGFKSFGDRTTVEFAPGVTAVVGPNGSGKSNILDALRWATGGGRAREFRADDKTALIFHGAAGKRRLGRAEVEVELHAGGKRLVIRRSLDRDGVTKLTLNGKNARFLDLDEELAGSGLGRGSLAVIGQGEVSGVLMADPSRLLAYVAEAAGVARLSGRREQTEGRLEAARGHLDRLEEKLAEDGERLAALRRDADDARRHDELSGRARRLRLTLAAARVRSLRKEVDGLETETARLEGELADGRAELADLREALRAARAADTAAEREHREATAAHARATAELRVAEHALEAATTRAADLERQRERTGAERDALLRQGAPEAPSDDVGALRAEAERADAAYRSAREERERAEARAEAARAERERLEATAASAARAAAEADAERDALRRQREEVDARLTELAASPIDRASGHEAGDVEAAERDAEETLGDAQAALDAARARLESAQAAHAREAAEARALARAVERQRAAFAARRGYAEGPRHALTSGVAGILGSLADVIRVPPELQEAIQLALGRRAEYVLADDAGVARRVLAHVRAAGGWVTLLPLDLVRGGRTRPDPELAAQPGVVGVASELVETEDRFAPAVEQVLGGTVLVETTEQATAIARRFARRPRLVTLEGDVVEPGGALSGGRRQGRSVLVGAAADLEEAEAQAAEASAAERAAGEAVGEAQASFRTARDRVEEATAAVAHARAAAARWREAQAAERHLRSDLEGRRERLADAERRLPEPPATIAPERLEKVRDDDAQARTTLQAARTAEAPASEAASAAGRTLALAEERRRAHAAAQARYDEDVARSEALGRELERLAQALEAGWSAARDAERRALAARESLPDDASATEEAREDARARLREAEEALEAAAEAQSRRAESLEHARVQSARREAALEAAEAERDGFPDGLEPLDLNDRVARAELRDAEAELETLGAVNHRAAQELEGLEEGHLEREREARDAREAVDRLASTLIRLDRETTSRLTAAIAGVRARFVTHLAELFGPDGEGDVEADLDEGRPVGLRIRLQPPGKQTQALGLLSVGERTMGALAFLFALMGEEQGGRGLPVAVLDEVDAPLDEANIRRYRTFLERMASHGTQFVLITHQKATFEVADVLWGVTTEQGVSRVFSIRKESDEPRALAGSTPP